MRQVKYTQQAQANGVATAAVTPAETRPGERADKVYRIVIIRDGRFVRSPRRRKAVSR